MVARSRRPDWPSPSTCRPDAIPRAVGGNGGAIINYVCHSMETTIEPLVQLITSGVFERHPGITAGLVEIGHRLRAVAARDDGLRLPGPPLLGAAGDPRAAVALLPAQLLRDVPGGPRRPASRRAARPRRQPACGRTTTRTTRARGRTPRHRSSARWATSPTSRGRRSSAPTQSACSPCSARPVVHGSAVVVGVGESTYYKRGGAPTSEFQLACIAIRNAVTDAGLQMRDIDGVVAYMERNEPVRLSAALGIGRPRVHCSDLRRWRQRRRRGGDARRRGDHESDTPSASSPFDRSRRGSSGATGSRAGLAALSARPRSLLRTAS